MEKKPPTPAAAPQANGQQVLIRSTAVPGGGETAGETFVRAIPAAVVSCIVHAVLVLLFMFVAFTAGGHAVESEESNVSETVVEENTDVNLTNEDIGLDPELKTNYNVDRIEEVSVPGAVDMQAPVGIVGADSNAPPQTIPPPPGTGGGQGGSPIDLSKLGGGSAIGSPGGMGGLMREGGFGGRSGATREKMLTEGGGSKASEAAVARALKWIALHQNMATGGWSLNNFQNHARDKTVGGKAFKCNCGNPAGVVNNDIAATAFALLPFLAAGETHKPTSNKNTEKYNKTVEAGLKFLIGKMDKDGTFAGSGGMYAHGLATIVLCEAYGLTSDSMLRVAAQRAIDYIVKAQHPAGGWRYSPGQAGDTSVVGWQVMALKSGQMSGLTVPKTCLDGAMKYLDSCMDNYGGYGYTGKGGSPTMTAVGLLCRQYLGWTHRNLNLRNGVTVLQKTPPGNLDSMYYYYYATQVMHHHGGEEWGKWNKDMREMLIKKQALADAKGPHQAGSWSPDGDAHGGVGGRLMQTSLSCLTLEVYYRHLPLYRRDMGGDKMGGEGGEKMMEKKE